MPADAPAPTRINGWDRAAIVALGAAGCALSYDALQQMAIAIHIRGPLTYLFPLVIDGFIAYGVRALLVLRNAPYAARLYAWTLFGAASAASVWANALHAIRLNEQTTGTGERLHLGDLTVGALSTTAPLALAGSVHLYIIIARRVSAATEQDTTPPGGSGQVGQDTLAVEVTRLADRRPAKPGELTALTDVDAAGAPRTGGRRTGPRAAGQAGRAAAKSDVPGRANRADVGAPSASEPDGQRGEVSGRPGQPRPRATADSRLPTPTGTETKPAASTEDLVPLARDAVARAGRVSRAVVAEAIRGQGYPLSSATLTEVMAHVRGTPGQPTGQPGQVSKDAARDHEEIRT